MDAHRLRRQKKILPPRHEPGSTPMRTGERLAGLVPLDLGEVAVSLSPSGAICASPFNGVYAARIRFLTARSQIFLQRASNGRPRPYRNGPAGGLAPNSSTCPTSVLTDEGSGGSETRRP